MKYCSKCGNELSDEVKFCNACGTCTEQPIENKKEIQTKKKKQNKIGIIALILILLIAVGTVGGIVIANNLKVTQEIEEYEENLEEVYELMIEGAGKAESYCSLQSKVWRNCIYEESSWETDDYTKNSYGYFYSDFNEALWAFEEGESLVYDVICDNKEKVDKYIKRLKNCPEELEDDYDDIKEMYVAYSELVDLATGDSSYSLNSFNDALESALADFKSAKSGAQVSVG